MTVEQLEMRRMLSIAIVGSQLTVSGTNDADVIVVNQKDCKTFEIFENGACTTISSTRLITKITINGLEGDDYLALTRCVTVKSYLNGGDDCDTLVGGSGADVFCGGDGNDTADYSDRRENLFITLNNVADDGAAGEHDNVKNDVENVDGGCGSDVIIGSCEDNILSGGKGNDIILGLDGDDLIDGGCGNDSLDGGKDDDVIIGGEGEDTMLGGCGDDYMEASDGDRDVVNGGEGYDTAVVDCEDNLGCVEKYIFADRPEHNKDDLVV